MGVYFTETQTYLKTTSTTLQVCPDNKNFLDISLFMFVQNDDLSPSCNIYLKRPLGVFFIRFFTRHELLISLKDCRRSCCDLHIDSETGNHLSQQEANNDGFQFQGGKFRSCTHGHQICKPRASSSLLNRKMGPVLLGLFLGHYEPQGLGLDHHEVSLVDLGAINSHPGVILAPNRLRLLRRLLGDDAADSKISIS